MMWVDIKSVGWVYCILWVDILDWLVMVNFKIF